MTCWHSSMHTCTGYTLTCAVFQGSWYTYIVTAVLRKLHELIIRRWKYLYDPHWRRNQDLLLLTNIVDKSWPDTSNSSTHPLPHAHTHSYAPISRCRNVNRNSLYSRPSSYYIRHSWSVKLNCPEHNWIVLRAIQLTIQIAMQVLFTWAYFKCMIVIIAMVHKLIAPNCHYI